MSDIRDIRPEVAKATQPQAPTEGDPRDFTVEQLQQIVQDGQNAVQAHLTAIPEMIMGLTNAAQQLGSMRVFLAQAIEQESGND